MNKFKKIVLIAVALCVSGVTLSACGTNSAVKNSKNNNPREASFINDEMKTMLNGLQRVDNEGYLYELTYDYNYYDPTLLKIAGTLNNLDAGCSAFTTYNTDADFILARNYDYKHEDKNGDPTGLNLFLRTAPAGKLKSIAMCDAYWMDTSNYQKAVLDDGQTDISKVMLSPFLCVDGMNEAGLSAALLALDTKNGEEATNQNTGKEKVIHSVLLRHILDNAKSIEEAIEIAKQYDVVSSSKKDIHLVVADKSGNTAILEWRQFGSDIQQNLYVTYSNALTNFFVGFDDGQDIYKDDGTLREKLTQVTGLTNNYRYGYGHGFHRFNGIVSAVDRYIPADSVPTKYGIKNATMMNSQAYNILSAAAQEPGLEKTSLTQFSALYDMESGRLGICLERDYTKEYVFEMSPGK